VISERRNNIQAHCIVIGVGRVPFVKENSQESQCCKMTGEYIMLAW